MPLRLTSWAPGGRLKEDKISAAGREQWQPQAAAAPDSSPPLSLPAPPSPTRRALQPPALPPWQRLQRALSPDPLAYLKALGPLAPTARPSSLQPLQRRGGLHAPSSLCRPQLAACGTRLQGLPTDRAGQLLPTDAAQCLLTLGTVKRVPGAGLPHRQPCRHVARACLYDGARFRGNVQAVAPKHVNGGRHGDTWAFGVEPLLVRCPRERLGGMQVGGGGGGHAGGEQLAQRCCCRCTAWISPVPNDANMPPPTPPPSCSLSCVLATS
jgi:hypothetical protein